MELQEKLLFKNCTFYCCKNHYKNFKSFSWSSIHLEISISRQTQSQGAGHNKYVNIRVKFVYWEQILYVLFYHLHPVANWVKLYCDLCNTICMYLNLCLHLYVHYVWYYLAIGRKPHTFATCQHTTAKIDCSGVKKSQSSLFPIRFFFFFAVFRCDF